ncbi:Nuclear cohesin complex subunit Psc3 [Trichuris trichiura]|uniref:Nuclear cohesin complex subunit Psc3 n=1 Tax=Trichuris trichiura TaxID=36087 RepID=A0A077Z116_TRITR|nr:Nuclear cohesin complex subunit Psc3 [Trichuris trichiura]
MKHGSCVDRISIDAIVPIVVVKDMVKETFDQMPPGTNTLTLEDMETAMQANPKYRNILSKLITC